MAWSKERLEKFRATIAKERAEGRGWGIGRKKHAQTQPENQAQGEQPAPTVEFPHAPDAQNEQPA